MVLGLFGAVVPAHFVVNEFSTCRIWESATKPLHPLKGLLSTASCCREELEFIANTLIFVLSGALITSRIWESATVHAVNDIHPADFAYAILLWVYLLVSPTTEQQP